jgi:predicted transcriptional regulator
MKSVLISIQPKWCELIASGKKTVEVRKTKPKLETPFKCYIYCTADRRKHICDTFVPQTPLFVKNGLAKSSIGREDGLPWKLGNGKVIGEFVCNEIENLTERDLFEGMDEISNSRIEEYSCVDIDELLRYKGSKNEIYGWHISDLVIYDKPRELSEFRSYNISGYVMDEYGYPLPSHHIKTPPQSWQYIVESEDTE